MSRPFPQRTKSYSPLALHGWRLGLRYVILSLLAVFFLFPFYLMVKGAFSTNRSFVRPQWEWVPELLRPGNQTSWSANLEKVFGNRSLDLANSLSNSAIVAVLQTVLTILLSLTVGYAMARFTGRMSRILHVLVLITMMIPATITFIPMFVITSSLQWINTYHGIIVPAMFSAMAAYMFESYFLGFPRELEEAGMIDGASPWGVFWRIVVPNSKGIIAAVTAIIFIGAWNSFLWPMLVSGPDTRTAPVAISRFMTSQRVDYPALYTGAILVIIPVIVVFLLLQRYLVQGVERSGMAGD